MRTLDEVFSIAQLSEEELGYIEYVLNSPAYEVAFSPYLKGLRDAMNQLMLDRSQARKNDLPDDYLAGAIAAVDSMRSIFAKIIAETKMERIHAAMAPSTPEREYAQRQHSANFKPIVGVNAPSEPPPYDPAEDF